MSPDVFLIIKAAEDEARTAIIIAQQQAQKKIEETKSAGEETVAATLARAESEIAHLIRVSDQKATTEAMELASTTANKEATLRARAERRFDSVAQQIVERIVSV